MAIIRIKNSEGVWKEVAINGGSVTSVDGKIGAVVLSDTYLSKEESGTINGDLTVNGTIYGKIVQSTSDERLKFNLEPVDYDLSSVQAYRYNFENESVKHIGLIAQQVEKVAREAVSEHSDGHLSLDYNAVVALLVNKVNQLEKRIDQLQNNQGN